MKDPLDREERPYEILGVAPDATVQAVAKAYSDFLRNRGNLARMHLAAVARDRLSRVERRLEDEMFYYPTPSGVGVGKVERVAAPFSHEPAPPPLTIDVPALVCKWPADDSDFDPFCERRVQIGNISLFEEKLLLCLPIEYPK